MSNDLAARTALEDQYGFIIVENKDVKIITDIDGSIYYSMLIERAIIENLKFENLIIKVKDDDVVAVILKYELNEKATYSEIYNTYLLDIKETEAESLEVEGKTFFISFSNNCIITTTIMCNQNPAGGYGATHIANEYCYAHSGDGQFLFAQSEYFCLDESSNGTPVIGSSTGGGGGGSVNYSLGSPDNGTNQNGETPLTNNTPPIKNVIIVDDEEVLEEADDPCDDLKKHLSTDTGLKLKSPQMYDYLKNQLNQPNEHGFYFKKENNVYDTFYSCNGTSNKITSMIGDYYFGVIHTHPYPSTSPMFSWEDVFNLQQYYQKVPSSLLSEVTIYLVCKDYSGVEQLYAIKIDNFTTFSDFLVNDYNNSINPQDLQGLTTPESQQNKMLELMTEKLHYYNQEYTNTNTQNPIVNLEVPFLNYFNGAGFSLYKANSNQTNWDKLTLSNNPNDPITKTPCN